MTTHPATDGSQNNPAPNAVYYIRLPKAGSCCPQTGLSRSKLNQLVLPCPENGFRPPVRSISLKPRGAQRGCRLIDFPSLIAYLRGQEQGS